MAPCATFLATFTMQTFKSYLSSLYGELTTTEVRSYERNSIKRSKHINNLTFLKRCRDSNIIPPGLRLHDPIRSKKSQSILHKASLALLRHRISATRSTLATLDKQISTTQEHLQSSTSAADYSKVQRLTLSSSNHAFKKSRSNQVKKFVEISKHKTRSISNPTQAMGSSISPRLQPSTPPMGSPISLRPQRPNPMRCSVPSNCLYTKPHLRSKKSFVSHTVVNMSHRTLSDHETKVLSLGMNFALVPQSSPVEEIIQRTEPTLRHLDKSTADEVRLQVHQVLRKHEPAKPNITGQERSAIKALRQDKSIHILRADKGNATVVMDKTEYDHKVADILNSNCYRKLRRDPTPSIERQLQHKLLSLQRSGNISQSLYRLLRPSNSKCPRFFGQPKIHKKDVP